MLWKFSRNIWLARNVLQHEATPEELLQNQKDKLATKIWEWYTTGQQEVSFLNRTRLFRVPLQIRIQKIQPHTNIRWLALMDSAKRSKTRHEEYLMERIPRLTTYNGFTATSTDHTTQQPVTQNKQEP